ncbi:MAG: acylphosphatase [Bacteroidota bacterium]|nr:acylphosphatase [Bacteroidota bacterium]
MVHYNIKVTGLVQGVAFRKHTVNKARELHLFGFVKNMLNGSVYIEAEGTQDNINQLVDWCHYGPSYAKVDRVETEEGPLKNFDNFQVRY